MDHKQIDAIVSNNAGQGDALPNYEHKLARRKFLTGSSVIAAAVVGVAVAGTSFTISHAAETASTALPVFRFVHQGGHFYTLNPTEAAGAEPNFGFHYEGVTFNAFKPGQAPANTISVIRLVKGFDHFYTIDPTEALAAANPQVGYKREGVAFKVYKTRQEGTIAIYRLHHPSEGHFYSGLTESRRAVRDFGFAFEPPVSGDQNPIPYFYALPPSSDAKF